MADGTVTLDVPLEVAADAETHVVHVVRFEHLRHAGDVAVTGAASLGTHRLHVDRVREPDMARQGVNASPFERGRVGLVAIVPEGPELPDFALRRAVGAGN